MKQSGKKVKIVMGSAGKMQGIQGAIQDHYPLRDFSSLGPLSELGNLLNLSHRSLRW